ncbi:VWA domain-containing protein [Pseudoxanthobacter sp. M-2]|uniref:VWA domain-containing protein n=1 Tax=Pseudoxanthobacter sp. M-2 TaxID=3078754 RepID=UPI0038FC1544
MARFILSSVTDRNRPLSKTTTVPSGLGEAARSSSSEIEAFLEKARTMAPRGEGQGRLVFALDATMSRQPTWDQACVIQAEMFDATAALGGLSVKLVYFRGLGECRASRWVADPQMLGGLMSRIDCRGGFTQIRKVLSHVANEAREKRVGALVYVGDACEEPVDELAARAGELALRGVPAFLFQEGSDATASVAFAEIARLTGGAHVRFSAGAGAELAKLLRAVAAYAAGGRAALAALEKRGDDGARLLLGRLSP